MNYESDVSHALRINTQAIVVKSNRSHNLLWKKRVRPGRNFVALQIDDVDLPMAGSEKARGTFEALANPAAW